MEIVLFTNPILLSIFTLALIFVILDICLKKIVLIFKILFAISLTAGVIFSLLFGATYQEIIIVTLLLLAVELFSFYGFKNDDEKDKEILK